MLAFDKWETQINFEPIASHPLFSDAIGGEFISIFSRETDRFAIGDPREANQQTPPRKYNALEITGNNFGTYGETIKHTVYKSPNGHITGMTAQATSCRQNL